MNTLDRQIAQTTHSKYMPSQFKVGALSSNTLLPSRSRSSGLHGSFQRDQSEPSTHSRHNGTPDPRLHQNALSDFRLFEPARPNNPESNLLIGTGKRLGSTTGGRYIKEMETKESDMTFSNLEGRDDCFTAPLRDTLRPCNPA